MTQERVGSRDKPVKILVFPCGSEIGLEIERALRYSREIFLLGGSSPVSNHGQCVFTHYIDTIPWTGSPDCLAQLNQIILSQSIDFIFPAHDDTLLFLAEHVNELECGVIAPSVETCKICRSKSRTYAELGALLPVPSLIPNVGEITSYPVFLKPDKGQGSRGVHTAHSQMEVTDYQLKDPSLLIMNYLPGEEWTVECFSDRESNLLFVGGRQRKRILNGIAVNTETVDDPLFSEYASIINDALHMHGPWFFQLKEDVNRQKTLLEVAPRIAGSASLFRALGVNLPLLAIYDAMGIDVRVFMMDEQFLLDRSLNVCIHHDIEYENVYVDYDDCIIIRDRINTMLLRFLLQCLNNNKRLFLLTKFRGDITDELRKRRIANLFDDVITLREDEDKSDHILNRPAIFIDDSFSERLLVWKTLKIPVFAPDAVPGLIDHCDL